MRRLAVLLCLMLSLAGVGQARSPIDYQLADGVTRTVLPNGLIVLVKPVPGARSVALDLMTRVGAAQEDNTTSGICKLVGHLLERRLYRPQGQPDDLLDRTGSVVNVNVSLDYTELSVVTSPGHYSEVLKRLLQAYGQRPFDATEIDPERKKMVKALENGEGDFNGVYDLFLQVFYRYHPYRQPLGGDADAMHKLTDDQLNAFINRWYAPNRTILCVVGPVDRNLAETLNDTLLGKLAAVPEPTDIITWEAVSTEKEVPLISDQHMAFLFLGYPAPSIESNDYAAMKVLNAIMGVGVSSRLWMDLREERGLAYELGSEYPTLEGPSHFLSFVITNPDQVRSSRHRLMVEMDRVRKEDPTQAEVDGARWKVAGSILDSIETPAGQASLLASSEAQGVGYQFTDRFMDSLWQVTPDDVKAVADRYLDNYTLLVARPEGTEPLLPDHLQMLLGDTYQARRTERQGIVDTLSVLDRRISNLRLFVFIMIFVVLYLGTQAAVFSAAWTLLPVALFVAMVVKHQQVLNRLERARRSVAFYDDGLQRLGETWQGPVTGDEYLDKVHPYTAGLDVFGPNSLYRLLCTARTRPGQDRLAAWLSVAATPAVVRARQLAVQDLRDRLDLREDLAVLTGSRRVLDDDRMVKWSETPPKLRGWALRLVAGVLGIATLAAGVAWLTGHSALPLGVLLMIESLVLQGPGKAVAEVQQHGAPLPDLEALEGFLERLEREKFEAPWLQDVTKPLQGLPSRHVGQLRRLAQWLDAPRNPFFAPIAYMAMWSVQFAHEVDGWRAAYGQDVSSWLEVVATLEALLSLATLSAERPEDIFPEVVEDGCRWDGEGVGHPLLPRATCIRNTVHLGADQQLYIVSGSNMSGKSSLLRTVGTNTVLALAGAPVRATRLVLSPLSVGASLLVSDSLSEGVSRFYAEIRRLRQIVDMAGSQPTLLFLLDEMLQGTNSYDRGIGATAVLQALVDRGAVGLVTTHDLNLTHIAEKLAPRAINVHFEDHLENGEMRFDYHLRDGVVEKSNAVELMRAVGLPV